MGRSVNIEPIALHNIKVFDNSLQFLYDQNKSDQEGSKTTIKHVYANPTNPAICSHFILGIYMCLNVTKFETSEFLFKTDDNNKKAATNIYCSQLKELLQKNDKAIISFIRLAHANVHGWRKGGATHTTSRITCPNTIPSVDRHDEWSVGKVLDVYWHFAEPGDSY